MSWLLLEVGVVIALAIFIVWFTLPKKNKPNKKQDDAPK